MWKPLPPSGPPASSGQLTRSVLVQLDDRTVHAPMILRGIPYNEATTRDQIIALFSRAPPLISPQTKAPTYPPNEPPRATLPPPVAAASAAAVIRRPLPRYDLTLADLRDYTDDEIDVELRHLGILFTGTTERYRNNNMIVDYQY